MIGSVEDINMYAQQLKTLPADYYPLFDICHIILCVLAVRKEAGRNFAWSHPVSAWISCVVASFAGSIICGPLLGSILFLNQSMSSLNIISCCCHYFLNLIVVSQASRDRVIDVRKGVLGGLTPP